MYGLGDCDQDSMADMLAFKRGFDTRVWGGPSLGNAAGVRPAGAVSWHVCVECGSRDLTGHRVMRGDVAEWICYSCRVEVQP